MTVIIIIALHWLDTDPLFLDITTNIKINVKWAFYPMFILMEEMRRNV